jgi:hypothetical protein
MHLESRMATALGARAAAMGRRLPTQVRGCMLAPVGYGARGATRQISPASTAM